MKTDAAVACTVTLDNGQGDYNHASVAEDGSTTAAGQKVTGLYTSTGLYSAFMEPYNVLQNLTQITKVAKDSRNTFLMMTNDTTHDVMMLQEPDYTPSQNVDNTDYEAEHADRFTVDGQTLRMETELQVHALPEQYGGAAAARGVVRLSAR